MLECYWNIWVNPPVTVGGEHVVWRLELLFPTTFCFFSSTPDLITFLLLSSLTAAQTKLRHLSQPRTHHNWFCGDPLWSSDIFVCVQPSSSTLRVSCLVGGRLHNIGRVLRRRLPRDPVRLTCRLPSEEAVHRVAIAW